MKNIELEMAEAAKIGSILVHAEEAIEDDGHPFDVIAMKSLLADDDVQAFLRVLRRYSLLPVKR